MSNILNPEFRWTPAVATDIRVTFRKAMQQTNDDDWRSRIEGAMEVLRVEAERIAT